MRIPLFILALALTTGMVIDGSEPTSKFIDAVEEMKTEGWVDDHARLEKVGIYQEIDRSQRRKFSDLDFYPLTYERSRVNVMDVSRKADNVKGKANLSQVRTIWAYFYRKDPQEEWNSDGVIEQWEFATEAEATKALQELEEIAHLVYFNTMPHYFQHENLIYIFHARAMAFSYDQIAVFDKFKSSFTERKEK